MDRARFKDQHHVVPPGNFRGDARQILAIDFTRKLCVRRHLLLSMAGGRRARHLVYYRAPIEIINISYIIDFYMNKY